VKSNNFLLIMLLGFVAILIIGPACDDDNPVAPEEAEPNTMIFRRSWMASSKPATLDQSHFRGWLNWYNPYDMVQTAEIWPDSEMTAGESASHVLHLYFEPGTTDRRWGNADYDTTGFDPAASWAGIMFGLHYYETDFRNAIGAIIRLKGNTGIMHVDIGQISEDINGNGIFDSEDDAVGLPNNIVDDGEDIGLDLLQDHDEPGRRGPELRSGFQTMRQFAIRVHL